MKTDMYLPTTGQHYLASSSQINILKRSGWVVYSDWLAAQQPVEPTPVEPTPAPEPASAPTSSSTTETDTSDTTVPAPSL